VFARVELVEQIADRLDFSFVTADERRERVAKLIAAGSVPPGHEFACRDVLVKADAESLYTQQIEELNKRKRPWAGISVRL
jgi:hypothetical protein